MTKRLTSGIVAAVVAIGMSVPAAGFAHSNKGHHYAKGHSISCPAKSKSGKKHGKQKGTKGKGKKCGHK